MRSFGQFVNQLNAWRRVSRILFWRHLSNALKASGLGKAPQTANSEVAAGRIATPLLFRTLESKVLRLTAFHPGITPVRHCCSN
jgi:hypothetical protein